jgi:hypothetical protein
MNTAPDEDRLAGIALELAVRVRDETTEDNGAWLLAQLPNPADWFRLAFVLAAAVPIDKSWLRLTAWTVARPVLVALPTKDDPKPKVRRRGKPCGTRAAAQRHRYHGEELCPPCREADREWERARSRTRRAAA